LVKAFDWQGNNVNTVLINNETDQPWFIAHEVTSILGFGQAANAVRYLDDDEKSLLSCRQLGLKPGREMLIINESGLYALIMRSRRPEAHAFRKWVTGEVQCNLVAG